MSLPAQGEGCHGFRLWLTPMAILAEASEDLEADQDEDLGSGLICVAISPIGRDGSFETIHGR